MNPASNLFLIGPMGAGKSSIGRRLAEHFSMQFLDMDDEIERRTGVDISLIFEVEKEAGFRERESRLLAEVALRQDLVLATGGGVVLREENRRILQQHGFVLFLATPVAQQLARLRRDQRRPLLRTPDREQKLLDMAEVRNPLYQSIADLTLVSDAQAITRAAERAIETVDRNWQRPAVSP
jgi:shikimate kinase